MPEAMKKNKAPTKPAGWDTAMEYRSKGKVITREEFILLTGTDPQKDQHPYTLALIARAGKKGD